MFAQFRERFARITRAVGNKGRLTEAVIDTTVRDIRRVLLEADVALPVVKSFCGMIKDSAHDTVVQTSLAPGKALVRSIHTALVETLGGDAAFPLFHNKKTRGVSYCFLVGLQGAGKTTTAAKLAYLLCREKKRVALVSVDVYRPAAQEQLRVLAAQHDIPVYTYAEEKDPHSILRRATRAAENDLQDILLIDTAGRMHVDQTMMDEIAALTAAYPPQETLFVVDSMAGQQAVHSARAFADAVPLTGTIVTKIDADARGGAALSVRSVTGTPIRFACTGEKVDDIELFSPQKTADRILGMGDIDSLATDMAAMPVDNARRKSARRVAKGTFTLDDFVEQFDAMHAMGGIGAIAAKLPGMQHIDNRTLAKGDRDMRRTKAVVQSMTRLEKNNPAIIKHSRKQRIARGAGVDVQTVNRVLTQFTAAQKMMKSVRGKQPTQLLRAFGRLQRR